MHLEVKEAKIDQLLTALETGAWQVPQFQRDFVWNEAQIIGLADSILRARPIGMVTLWAQADDEELPLEPVSITDWDKEQKKSAPKYFAPLNQRPNTYYAILDGRQRCTSIAMVFGGLHPENGKYRFAGKFYLNVAEGDPTRRIIFKKNADIETEGLETRNACIGKGLFPLALDRDANEGLLGQWMSYLQAIRDPSNYHNGKLPEPDILAEREQVLREAFSGLNSTKMAVYVVPSQYRLDEICEIFETLNTTGTKVSTVDLIHSTLYAETQLDPDGGIDLREWIDELGQLDGATGWANREKRPELIAQLVTACYVALDAKAEPRKRPGIAQKSAASVSSVKSADLLATPAAHWRNVINSQDRFADFLGDFQKCTAEGFYPMSACPYPISSAIYVGLRWRRSFEQGKPHWSIDDLNALYRAFFWRNSLTNRYDQGFLTQLGSDLKSLITILNNRANFSSAMEWAQEAQKNLSEVMDVDLPTKDDLKNRILRGRHTGAQQKALLLPLVGRARKDILDPAISLAFPDLDSVEMHHIFPRTWCENNSAGALKDVLDPDIAGFNYRESVANLIPLSRTSNNAWRGKVPGQAIIDAKLDYANISRTLERYFISKDAFDSLISSSPDPLTFWESRAEDISSYLCDSMNVQL